MNDRAALRSELLAELHAIADAHFARIHSERRQHSAAELFAREAEVMLVKLADAGLDLDPVERKHLAWLAGGETETFAVVMALLLEPLLERQAT